MATATAARLRTQTPHLTLANRSRSTVKFADPDDVLEQSRNWSPEVLKCRSFSHEWKGSRATWEENGTVLHAVLLCTSCHTKKHFELTRYGKRLGTWYEYADGYLSKGLGRISGDSKGTLMMAAVEQMFNIAAA